MKEDTITGTEKLTDVSNDLELASRLELSVHRLECERWFLLGVVYALLIAFLVVVTRGEY